MITRLCQNGNRTRSIVIDDIKRALERERLYVGRLIESYSDALRNGNLDLAYEIESEMNNVGRRFCELNMLQLKLSEREN